MTTQQKRSGRKKGVPQTRVSDSRFTVSGWAGIIGVDNRTVARRISESNLESGPDGLYSGPDLYAAMSAKADIEESKARKLKAEAEIAEMERDRIKGDLYDADQIREAYLKIVGVIEKRVEVLPQVWAARCNPSKPELAHKALSEAARHVLRPLKEGADEQG
jgi:hypothetical protein